MSQALPTHSTVTWSKSQLDKVDKWLADKDDAQAAVAAHETPAFASKDVEPQLKSVQSLLMQLNKKPAPKVEKVDKKAAQNETAAATDETAATAEGGDAPVGGDAPAEDAAAEEGAKEGEGEAAGDASSADAAKDEL